MINIKQQVYQLIDRGQFHLIKELQFDTEGIALEVRNVISKLLEHNLIKVSGDEFVSNELPYTYNMIEDNRVHLEEFLQTHKLCIMLWSDKFVNWINSQYSLIADRSYMWPMIYHITKYYPECRYKFKSVDDVLICDLSILSERRYYVSYENILHARLYTPQIRFVMDESEAFQKVLHALKVTCYEVCCWCGTPGTYICNNVIFCKEHLQPCQHNYLHCLECNFDAYAKKIALLDVLNVTPLAHILNNIRMVNVSILKSYLESQKGKNMLKIIGVPYELVIEELPSAGIVECQFEIACLSVLRSMNLFFRHRRCMCSMIQHIKI